MGWFDREASTEGTQDASIEMVIGIIDGMLRSGNWASGTWTLPKPGNWDKISRDVRRQLSELASRSPEAAIDLTSSPEEISIILRDTSPEAGAKLLQDRSQSVQRQLSKGEMPDESGLSVYFTSLFRGYLRHEAVQGLFGRTTGWHVYFINEMNNVSEAFIDRRGRRQESRR